MRTKTYCAELARQIDAALTAAEKHAAREGFALYPFIFGYLAGDCTDAQQAAFNARLERLSSTGASR